MVTKMTSPKSGIKLIHIRHATSVIMINGKKILIDPMLSGKESLPPVPLTGNKLKNPRTELPYSPEQIIENIDYLLLTHLHFDHFDKKALEKISGKIPVYASDADCRRLRGMGFSATFPIENKSEINGIGITRYPAVHGKGFLKSMMGKGSSYLLDINGFKIFLTGDNLLTNSLKDILINTKPDVVIANAGAAKFRIGKAITMSVKDIQAVSKILPESKIYVVHLDALNHCTESRDYCKNQLLGYSNIYLPDDGEEIDLN